MKRAINKNGSNGVLYRTIAPNTGVESPIIVAKINVKNMQSQNILTCFIFLTWKNIAVTIVNTIKTFSKNAGKTIKDEISEGNGLNKTLKLQ